VIAEFDWSVGQIVDKLQALGTGHCGLSIYCRMT
jgi:hypothetical protein